jgi:hypothetical protein
LENRAAPGIVATQGIMPHGTQKLNCREKLSFQEKIYYNFLLTTLFCMNESFLVAYDFRELHKKLELKLIKNLLCQRLPKMDYNPNLVA